MSDLRVRRGVVIPATELRESASRSSGPGGQHVNKTSTRVTLRWNVELSTAIGERQRALLRTRLAHRLTSDGELIVHASSRSQSRNREVARDRLAQLVADALKRTPPRVATRPSRSAVSRGAVAKKRRSDVKRSRRRPTTDD
jgi:ribosome-associated protein